MSRTRAYLADRARIQRPVVQENKRVVSARDRVVTSRSGKEHVRFEEKTEPIGDWIHARIRPVSGRKIWGDVVIKLEYSHEIILHHHDLSDNEVLLTEADQLEIRACRNGVLEDKVVQFKVAGAIREIRKRSRVVSYVVPAILQGEF